MILVKTSVVEMHSMRRIAITIVLLISCMQLGMERAYATTEGCAVVVKTPDGFLNIRQTPSSNGRVLGQATPGDVVAIVGDTKGEPSGRWSYLTRSFEVIGNKIINERNISGWASTRYLSVIECPDMDSNKTINSGRSQATIDAANSDQFECFGTEPFWDLVVGSHGIRLKDPGSETSVAMQLTRPRSATGMSKEYVLVYETRSIEAASKPVTIVLQTGE